MMLQGQAPDQSVSSFFQGISALAQRWEVRAYDERAAAAISQRLGLPEAIGRLLAGRGIGLEEAEDFLNPTLRRLLPDPFHLKDMDIAADRLAAAIAGNETIALFGDYDVDGATSTALLTLFLRAAGAGRVLPYIPDRQKEGYGPNLPALLALRAEGATLALTLDCGTVAFEPLQGARDAGLDMIVVDHHAGEIRRPAVLALVNPNRFDETSTEKHLAAVGVAFLLAVATNRRLREAGWYGAPRKEPDLLQWLDLVALGTVCDVVPLTGINRAFVAQGLKVMAQRRNTGLKILMDQAGLNAPPNPYHAGFLLGPRINAGGRVGQAPLGAKLLTTQDETEAQTIAAQLEQFNAERKTIEAMVLEEALTAAAREPEENAMLLLGATHWHPGVIGIVAGRVKEQFHKPTAIIAWGEDGVGKASARSVPGVDLGAAVAAAKEAGLLQGGGGHAMAAGFSLARDQLAPFQAFLNERCQNAVTHYDTTRHLKLDGILNVESLTPALATQLERAGPYGSGHPEPRFAVTDAKLISATQVGDTHLRLVLQAGGVGSASAKRRVYAMAFRCLGTPLGNMLQANAGRTLHLAGIVRLDHWQGEVRLSFHVEDAMAIEAR